MKRDFGLISEEKRREAIKETISFFENERGEKIGIVAAEEILDNFLEAIGKDIYNKGISDSIKFANERFGTLEMDMDSLLKK